MTDIAFHFGAPDKWAYACRLLRKASGRGARVQVLVPEPMVAKLDADLWAVAATEFVTHCTSAADNSVKSRSAVLLVSDMEDSIAPRQVLVNLGNVVPSQFDTFQRVIEVVSFDETDRLGARARWKRYTELGYPITRHDLALRGDKG